jgi:hypothetical protein
MFFSLASSASAVEPPTPMVIWLAFPVQPDWVIAIQIGAIQPSGNRH